MVHFDWLCIILLVFALSLINPCLQVIALQFLFVLFIARIGIDVALLLIFEDGSIDV